MGRDARRIRRESNTTHKFHKLTAYRMDAVYNRSNMKFV
jgi:hypothetical protein